MAVLAAPLSSSCFPILASQISPLNRRVMGGIGIGGGGRRRTFMSSFRSSAISAPVIESQILNCLSETHLHQIVPGLDLSSTCKVRDIYEAGHHVILVSTDRLSAFDRVLAAVPFKGQVLNQTSLWWFDKTKLIVPNAAVAVPDPNVTIATRFNVFQVEFVVRGFVTGSASTSRWTAYNKGVRNYCGNDLPDDCRKRIDDGGIF